MPSYEATPEEMQQYGANLTIWEQLRLLSAWAPLVGFAQQFVTEPDSYRKSLIVADAAEWVAAKTDAQTDDELVRLLANLLRTKEGEALVAWALAKTKGMP